MRTAVASIAIVSSVALLSGCMGSPAGPEGATPPDTRLAFTDVALLPVALTESGNYDTADALTIAEYEMVSLEVAPWIDLENALQDDDYQELIANDRAMYLRYTITIPEDLTFAGADLISLELGSMAVERGQELRIIGGADTCESEIDIDFETNSLLAGTYQECDIFIFESAGGGDRIEYDGLRLEGLDGYTRNPVVWTAP